MKTCVIFHDCDLDGWMSAAIVKHWWQKEQGSYIQENNHITNPNTGEDSIDFLGYNYGQPIPDLSNYDKVIMCDISFPKDKMFALGASLTWIDHHISAIKEIDEFLPNTIEGLRDTKFAACELTWKYFFPNEPMPEIVRLLGLYDSFRHKGTDEETKVLEFQYGARQCISNYEQAYKELVIGVKEQSKTRDEVLITYRFEDIHIAGISIYKYLCTEAKQTYKNEFVIYFRYSPGVLEHRQLGFTKDVIYKFICINKERFNPINFGIDYHKDGYDGAACFHYANGMWNFSLYNDNGEVDVSQIAKQYGGGGHFSASGFRCDSNTFLKIINNG